MAAQAQGRGQMPVLARKILMNKQDVQSRPPDPKTLTPRAPNHCHKGDLTLSQHKNLLRFVL